MSTPFDPDLSDLLERLAPPPDAIPAWEEIVVRVARERDATAARTVGHGTRTPRRAGRRMLALAGGVTVVAAAAAVLLLAPWRAGPAALPRAQAATIVRHAIAAATDGTAGGIFHQRYEVTGVPWPGAGRVARATNEIWQESDGRRRYRALLQTIVPSVSIEVGTVAGVPGVSIYDPRTNAIYRLPPSSAIAPLGPRSAATADVASTLRRQLSGGGLADGWVVTRTTLQGRDVYRISNMQSSPSGPTGVTYYVDAADYAPVQIEEPGFPKDQPGGLRRVPGTGFSLSPTSPASLTVTHVLTSEHLDATGDALAQLDLRRAHPTATEQPFSALRPDVEARVVPVAASAPAPTAPSTGGGVPRVTIDPEAASVGGFRVGDELLRLATVLPPPYGQFPLPAGNLKDAAAAGTVDRDGILVVTFRDLAEEHSTSVYLTRPFTTARGDVNGTRGDRNGTTLDEFLRHWPRHGAPTRGTGAQGTATTAVTVADATFYFGTDDRLAAVKLGDGDADAVAFAGSPAGIAPLPTR